jgi:formylmethanofuran dehydrogenase subunit A
VSLASAGSANSLDVPAPGRRGDFPVDRLTEASTLKIINGRVYDPSNGVGGTVHTISIKAGRIVTETELEAGATTIDAHGMLVLPGGVDMHTHIAGSKVNTARKMRPEDHRRATPVARTSHSRSGVMGSTPSTFAAGYAYARLGYTTAIDAAVPPLGARHAHEELEDTPILDKGFLMLVGNNEFALDCIKAGEMEKLRHFIAWLLGAAKGFGLKAVNPGGVEAWKGGHRSGTGFDELVPGFDVTPRQVVVALAQTAIDLGLPHPLHLHANNLGVAGNWSTTLDTMKALEGRRAHFAHIQFHSYGGDPGGLPRSRVADLVEYVNDHDNVSVDVGQVMFGDTTSMTADAPVGQYLHQLTRRRWFSGDVEMESGCGIVPIAYRSRSHVNATQWAAGLEWFLAMEDPWRIALTTDHPNGATFLAYPQLIRLLMDREYRKEASRRVNQKALADTRLPELDREYSLSEIAIITRAAPARLLGLSHKGHLGIGADADIALYDDRGAPGETFAQPRLVIKAGEVVAKDGEISRDLAGETCYVAPPTDPSLVPEIERWFTDSYTIRFRNYPVDMAYLRHPTLVPTTR